MPAGRPVSFWMQHEFIERLDEAAEAAGMTRSQWVMDALRLALRRPGPASPPAPPAD